MFGGITEDSEVINDLYILKIETGGQRFEWEKVEKYNGQPPCERWHHFMDYCEWNNSIIVHGGRNDNKVNSPVLNDLYFLQMDTLTWIEVKFEQGKIPLARFSHACTIFESKIIIFGGVGRKFSMEKSIEIIELNPDSFNIQKLE